MSCIAFVPVRIGSKSIYKKNIKLFCGHPLLYWTLNALCSCKSISKVVLAYDSVEIVDSISAYNFDKIELYHRDKKNSEDTSSTESVMLEYLYKNNFDSNDFFLLAQVTSPFTTQKNIEEAIQQLELSSASSLLSCVSQKRFLWNKNGDSQNYDFNNRPRRQDFESFMVENGAFYINTVGSILKDKNRLSKPILLYEMPEYSYFEIDEEFDWVIAEEIFKKIHLPKVPKVTPKAIKLLVTDVDGVLTDAGMYYSEKGDELKKFSTYDGMAIELLKKNKIEVAIITGENTNIVSNRAKKLKITRIHQGIKDKINVLTSICNELSISIDEVAYIGDDINDFIPLSKVGIAGCPANAVNEIKSIPKIHQLSKRGGEGVLREFVELVLKYNNNARCAL